MKREVKMFIEVMTIMGIFIVNTALVILALTNVMTTSLAIIIALLNISLNYTLTKLNENN